MKLKKLLTAAIAVFICMTCACSGDEYRFTHDELYQNGYAALIAEHPYLAADTLDTLDVIRMSQREYQVRFFEIRNGSRGDMYTVHLNFDKDYDGNVVYTYSVDTKFNF